MVYFHKASPIMMERGTINKNGAVLSQHGQQWQSFNMETGC